MQFLILRPEGVEIYAVSGSKSGKCAERIANFQKFSGFWMISVVFQPEAVEIYCERLKAAVSAEIREF